MTPVVEDFAHPRVVIAESVPWITVLAGLAALYLPTYADLARGAWTEEAHAHGALVLAVFGWLVWRKRRALAVPTRPAVLAGLAVLVVGLAAYLVGRALSIVSLEVASHIPVIAGAVLMIRGGSGLRMLAFPILFLAFAIPLPSFVIETATAPLKEIVSIAVQALLSVFGYDVHRAGVVLEVRGHELLIADACSGLNSIYSLFALALLYAQMVGPRTRARMAWLLLAVVPIAITANILRVTLLALITVHFGDEAAAGFLHGFAGMVVFLCALLLLIQFDIMARRYVAPHALASEWKLRTATRWMPAFSAAKAGTIVASGFGLTFLMVATAIAVPAVKPRGGYGPAPDFGAAIPQRFGAWHLDPHLQQVPPTSDVQASLDRIYDQIVARTYVGPNGEHVMLLVAYGGEQNDALKAHRQEGCYASQGFEIRDLHTDRFAIDGRSVPVTRMQAVRGERSEPVTYWFTMGDRVVMSRMERLGVQLSEGRAGRVPDGLLVRVSSLSTDPQEAFRIQEAFLQSMITALPEGMRWRFVGRGA